jgi:anti-sigma factor RsiW
MDIADRILWQRSQSIDAVEDEGARYLDMAAFAEGRLDPDEREHVAEWLRSHPDAVGDIEAARALASGAEPAGHLSEAAVARACALVGGGAASRPGSVIPFRARAFRRPALASITQWGSLAAAMVVAGWLGFALGMDASGIMGPNRPGSDDGVMQDLFGSSPVSFRDLTGGA